jgi:hypothetical protein
MYLLHNKVRNEVNLVYIFFKSPTMKIIKVQQFCIAELLLFILSYSS